METVVITSERFIDEFISTLKKYQVHNFIIKQQALAFKESRENLDEGELVVILDFAENNSFVVQDEIQSFHWNNLMATLYPFVANYKENGLVPTKVERIYGREST